MGKQQPQKQSETVGIDSTDTAPARQSRRVFLGRVSGATAAAMAAGVAGLPPLLGTKDVQATAAVVGRGTAQQRRNKAYSLRQQTALQQKIKPLPSHRTNGDEEAFPNQFCSYSKALPHNGLGEVNLPAYRSLVDAMDSGETSDFELIPLGGAVKLTNPQAAFTFDLEGADSHHLGIPAPPKFSSEEAAGEMAELYWAALTRDVPFSQFGSNPLTLAAVADLAQFAEFSGVSPGNLFRGHTPGDLVGPYVSQFLLKEIPAGPRRISQQIRTAAPGVDYMTSYAAWLNIQNGVPGGATALDPTLRFIRNGRDLGEYVHRDYSFQSTLDACLILLSFGGPALDSANPYLTSTTQGSFVSFGPPNILDLTARVANCALRATWYQKWSVHRRLRPEEFGGRVHNHKTGAASYPIHPKLLASPVLAEVFNKYGTYLLPMAYAEGCPTHPAYPAGHAAFAGAGVTVLKAFFNESFVIPGPVEPSDDGLTLLPYTGPALTVGGELNKLAANIALSRDTAGVHWRSDGIEGIKLGEAAAISVLADMRETYNEDFDGFSLTKFDGTTITI